MSTQKATHKPKKSEFKKDLKAFQHDLRALRDEVRLKVHLAGMDLRDEWESLEPQIEKAINSAAVASADAMNDLKDRLNGFLKRIGPPAPPAKPS